MESVAGKSGDGEINHLRVLLAHRVIVQAKARGDAGAVVLDHHVGVIRQAQRNGVSFRVLQIQCQAALAPVEGHAVGAVVAIAFADLPAPIAGQGFQLDHVGAMARQQHAAMGPGDALRYIQDLQALIRQVFVGQVVSLTHVVSPQLAVSHRVPRITTVSGATVNTPARDGNSQRHQSTL